MWKLAQFSLPNRACHAVRLVGDKRALRSQAHRNGPTSTRSGLQFADWTRISRFAHWEPYSMADVKPPAEEMIEVDLRNPGLAALLAWLWPGAGHIYQGRTGKGALFMVCILSTWFFGLLLGHGHSVYASNKGGIAQKLVFGCQVATGLPVLPAVVQAFRVSREQDPLWDGFMAPPLERPDELSSWHREFGVAYDLGVLYTMIAGLLNVLAIYDAYGGPVVILPEDEKKKKPPGDAANTEATKPEAVKT